MSKLINGFIGATILAGVAACSTAPFEAHNDGSKALITPPKASLSEEERVTRLSEARFVADVTARNALKMLTSTDVFAKLAKAKKVNQEICAAGRDIESSGFLRTLNEVFESTVTDEVKYGGELEEEKVHRLAPMKNISKQIDGNLEIVKQACDLKFGA